jgi:hypothetical protein
VLFDSNSRVHFLNKQGVRVAVFVAIVIVIIIIMSLRKRVLLVTLTGLLLLMGYHFETFQGSRLEYLNNANGIAFMYNDVDHNHHNNNNKSSSTSNSIRNATDKLNETELLTWIEGSTTSSPSTTITPSPHANSSNNKNNSSTNSSSSDSDKLNEKELLKWIDGSTTSSPSTTITSSPHTNSSNNNHTAQPPAMATIIVQLAGELGNHLSYWSNGKGLQLQLLQDYGIAAELVLRHQVYDDNIHGTTLNDKAKPTASKIQLCFPNLRSQPTFGSANTEYFARRYYQQADWLTNKSGILMSEVHERWLLDLSRVNGKQVWMYQTMSEDDVDAGLTAFDQLLRLPPNQKPITTTATTTTTTIRPTSSLQDTTTTTTSATNSTTTNSTTLAEVDTISIPYLYVTGLNINYMWNRYYDEFRTYFAFDDTACCNAIPEPDETVFVRRQSVCVVYIYMYVCVCQSNQVKVL